MKKNKEWLKRQLEQMNIGWEESHPEYHRACGEALRYIDQLNEPELPVIPQFVADYLDDFKKQNLTLGDALDTHFEDDKQIHRWLYEDGEVRNDEVFARAWLYDYTIEEEKRYYVYDKATKSYLGYNVFRTQLNWWTSRLEKESFTEQEIKAIDERYWAFAEEVTDNV